MQLIDGPEAKIYCRELHEHLHQTQCGASVSANGLRIREHSRNSRRLFLISLLDNTYARTSGHADYFPKSIITGA